MDYSHYLKTNIPDFDRLKDYGFQSVGNAYVFQKDLSEAGLYALIRINLDSIDVRVIDKAFEDDYLPFSVKDNQCAAKAEVEALLSDIAASCFTSVDAVSDIMTYMEKTYGVKHEEPWERLPGYYTFKTPNSRKWCAIIMHLPQSRLGLEGGNMIDIICVKIASDQIEGLVDNRHYFPAYHMSKKNWITVLLDKDTDMEDRKSVV